MFSPTHDADEEKRIAGDLQKARSNNVLLTNLFNATPSATSSDLSVRRQISNQILVNTTYLLTYSANPPQWHESNREAVAAVLKDHPVHLASLPEPVRTEVKKSLEVALAELKHQAVQHGDSTALQHSIQVVTDLVAAL